MKNYTKSTYINLLLISALFLLASQNSFAQVEEEAKEDQTNIPRLIREGATYLGASVGLNIAQTKLPNGESELNVNGGGKAQYAFADYFAFGGEFVVSGYVPASEIVPSRWIIAMGPSLSFFIPNNSPLTPYAGASGGYAHVLIGENQEDESGSFYSGNLGVVYEVNHFFGIGLEYSYSKFNFANNVSSFSLGGFGLGVFFSL